MPKGFISFHDFNGKRYYLAFQKNNKEDAKKYASKLRAEGNLARIYPRKAMDGSTIYLIYKRY